MSSRYRRALGPLFLWLVAPLLPAQDIKITAGTVEDQRFSDERFGGLSIELVLKGSSVADVKALRVKVKSAKDDLGSSLVKPEREAKDFEEFSTDRRPGPQIGLSSPRRDASTVDIAGEVELFLPGRDPNTKLRFEQFMSRLDKPISSSALKSAKAEITPLSAKEYKAREAKNRPTKEQITAEGKKNGASDAEIQQALALMEALSALGGEDPTENTLLFETKDPDGKIISIDVVRADGAELQAPSRSTSGGREKKMVKIDLSGKPPADAVLVVTLRTAKSLVTVPLNLKEVSLP